MIIEPVPLLSKVKCWCNSYIIIYLKSIKLKYGIRDVNSREINFPGGKRISRDSIGTRTSVCTLQKYKHFASVLVSFKVGRHVFASRCSHLSVGPPSMTPPHRASPLCSCASSVSLSPPLSTRRPSLLLHLIWHAL